MNKTVGSIPFVLLFLASTLASPAEAQPLRDETDQILMYFDETQRIKQTIERSLGTLEVRIPVQPGMIPGIHDKRTGVGTLARCNDRLLVLFPAGLAEDALSVRFTIANQKPVEVKVLGKTGDIPLGVGTPGKLPEGATGFPIAAESEERLKGLVLTGIADPGPTVLAKVFIVETPRPPLEKFRITDIKVPDGSPMLTPDLKVLAIPLRTWGAKGHSLAAHATTMRQICEKKLPLVPIETPSLEINP